MSCNSFSIFTLDAEEILHSIKESDIEKGSDGNFKVVFRVDLSDKNPKRRDIVLRKDDCPTNALFEQICKIVTKSPEKDSLLRYLVFIDFSKIFFRNISWSTKNKTTPSKEDFLAENSLAYLTKAMFGEDGIKLSFDGKNYERFLAFDKSANMARKSVISFVNDSIRDDLEKRLTLDLDFSTIQVVLSKYYAYRGLYLSTARRIESLTLNEKTVVVLSDVKTGISQQVFTIGKNGEFRTESKVVHLNSFDGEGLICPDYVEIINRQLKKRDATSFQIRMPFTKGVLHSVDFLKFFTEELGFEKDKPLLVEDFFGIKRDLTKAKIILTESMFKAVKWIKKLWETQSICESDPMKHFFKKMKNYRHTIYVATTDANLSNTGEIRLNYQFLSTLDLTSDEFDSLLEDGIDKIKNIPESVQNIFQASSDNVDTDSTQDNEENPELPTHTSTDESNDEKFLVDDMSDSDDEKFSLGKTRDKMLKALARNDAFLRDPKVKSLIQVMQLDSEKSLFLGEFNVQGEVRFFSCDLLKLLLCIAEKIIGSNIQKEKIEELNSKTLESEYFYMPKKKMELEADIHYVFLRSPHLSRNEQCLLRPYVETESLYKKYFSNLTGVVMVSCKSPVPMALGGADFDGDLVKVISDNRIVEAVKRGVYYVDVEEKKLLRRLPIIQIPSTPSNVATVPKSKIIPFEVIKNTFANQIGLISDLAVKLASVEYSSSKQESEYDNTCAKATIVVGLEVDAAKTGKHPDEIQVIKELAKKTGGKSKFLSFKKIMERLNSVQYTPIIEKTENDGYEFYLSKKALEAKKATFSMGNPENEAALLDLLPYRYLQFLHEKQSGKYEKEEIKPRNEHYFAFEEDKNWRKNLESEKIDNLKKLLEAYSAVKRFARTLNASRQWWAKQKFDSFAIVLLDIQYDDISSVKLLDEVTVNDAWEKASDLLDRKSLEGIEDSLKSLREEDWHLTSKKDDRNSKLSTIIKTDVSPEVQSLLSNFRDNGFMLLFYVLSDKRVALKKAINDEEYAASHKKLTKIILDMESNPYWKDLHSKYFGIVSSKESMADRLSCVVSFCREKLEDIFKGDEMKKSLQYYWSIKSKVDPSRDFFWRVFTGAEILNNLAKEGGTTHDE